MTDISTIEEINYLTNFRKKLHQFPELSGDEKQTAQAVVDELKGCNPSTIITKLGGHGVAAIFKGPLKGKTILFRAELDALPIQEVNTFEHVIECLMNYCRHEPHQAEQCALTVHNKGKCSVKEGDLDTLKPLKEALCENYIDAKIE